MALPLDVGLQARSRVGLKVSDYPGMTMKEAREAIVQAIGNKVPCVAGEHINNTVIGRVTSNWYESLSQMATDGIVWAEANVQGSGTYPVTKNKPVCLDPTTGKFITGIDPDWQPTEYYVVGIAMKGFTGPGRQRIPIKLSPPGGTPAVPDTFIGVSIPDDDDSSQSTVGQTLPYPSFEDWCKGIYYHNTWRFQLRTAPTVSTPRIGLYDFSVSATLPPFDDAFYVNNIQGCYYIHLGQQVLIHKVGPTYYFNYVDNKVYSGTLLEDLPVGGGPVKVAIFSPTTIPYAWIYSDIGVASWAIPAGARVIFGITGRIDNNPQAHRLKYTIIAADMCAQTQQSPGGQ